jgi:asparagine synthase (glutamine-hydrolysing)
MARIVLLRWQPVNVEGQRAAKRMWSRLEADRSWIRFMDRRGVFAHYICAAHEPAPLNLGDERGAIFGSLFSKATPGAGRVTELTSSAVAALVDEGGVSLMREYWGAWTALIHNTGTDHLHAMRDPAGAGPIYEGGTEQVRIICTHASDYVRMVETCEPDTEVLAASIVSPSLVTPRTAILGLNEIFPGERLTLPREAGVVRRELLWRPLPQGDEVCAQEFQTAAESLRNTMRDCSKSWAHGAARIVHRLSGGLDSSIVLSGLRAADAAEIVALNEYSADAPEGDERAMARISAAKFNTPLVEVEMSPARVDWTRLLEIELGARPLRQAFSLADSTICDAIAAIDEKALVTSGQGGDQVFHRSHLPFMAADAWADGLPLRSVLRVALDTARLGRRHAWAVFGTAIKHGLLRRPLPPGGAAGRVLMFDSGLGAKAALNLDARHPWASEMRRTPPARALRIGLIADLQNYRQRDAVSLRFAKAQIVTSQPIVEFCLRVPPYVMTQGGRDRSLVRAAFADVLPPEVLARTSKGATTRYHANVAHRHFPLMREMLTGGEAEKLGLLDAKALGDALGKGEITSAPQSAALLSCFLVELWLRQFKAEQERALHSRHVSVQGGATC